MAGALQALMSHFVEVGHAGSGAVIAAIGKTDDICFTQASLAAEVRYEERTFPMWRDWFQSVIDFEISLASALGGLGMAIGLFVLSQLVLIGVLVAIPADFFSRQALAIPAPRRGIAVLRWSRKILKNAAGAVIILLGLPLAFPGIPGPGLVLIIVGIALLDFPGKRQLQYRLISHPRVFRSINSLRSRFGRPEMIV